MRRKRKKKRERGDKIGKGEKTVNEKIDDINVIKEMEKEQEKRKEKKTKKSGKRGNHKPHLDPKPFRWQLSAINI